MVEVDTYNVGAIQLPIEESEAAEYGKSLRVESLLHGHTGTFAKWSLHWLTMFTECMADTRNSIAAVEERNLSQICCGSPASSGIPVADEEPWFASMIVSAVSYRFGFPSELGVQRLTLQVNVEVDMGDPQPENRRATYNSLPSGLVTRRTKM